VTVTEPDRSASLIIALTGFHLLNIASIVVFGIWKVLLAGDGRLVVVTKVELGLVMLSSVMSAFFFLFRGWRTRRRTDGFLPDCTTSRDSQKIVRRYARVSSKSISSLLSVNSYFVSRVSGVPSCLVKVIFN